MSIFRPARRIEDLDGRRWELYAYRFRLPERDRSVRRGPLRRLGRALADLPGAALAARRSDEWTIEAVSWLPPTRYTWTTTSEYRGQVLAQVEAGVARGEIPRPRNATFVGTAR